MEDYEAQEQEFWRKLEEGEMSRSQMLKRSVAAATGLTVLGSSGAAFASRGAAGKTPPVKGSTIPIKELVAEAKKEGKLNTIALPPDWANYGEMMSTFSKKYGIPIDNQNPNGSSAEENQAIRSLKGDARAPDGVDVGVSFAVAGAAEGLYAKYFVSTFSTIPRAMKDTRGLWWGDYWGAISIGYNANLISNPPKTWKDLLKPEYKGKVAMNGSPLTSNSAVSGVIAASIGNGGSATDAMDVVADFRTPMFGGPARRALDLTEDTGIITAVANDIGTDAIFLRQVIAYGRKGDVLLALSTSGNSLSILEALREGRKRGMVTMAFVGYDGGNVAANNLADHIFISRSENIPRIQEAHASGYHVLRELVELLGPEATG